MITKYNMDKPLYIFDLDGTLALIEHRRHMLTDLKNPNRWDEFYKACIYDLPNQPIINIFKSLNGIADCLIFSGRSDVVLNETVAWLHNQDIITYYGLLMRPQLNTIPDQALKSFWYESLSIDDKNRLMAIFDDRQKVVDMWRSKGLTCLQVAPGDF
jgi:trehalose-6-phosphatase